jgi:hypothetical protein
MNIIRTLFLITWTVLPATFSFSSNYILQFDLIFQLLVRQNMVKHPILRLLEWYKIGCR